MEMSAGVRDRAERCVYLDKRSTIFRKGVATTYHGFLTRCGMTESGRRTCGTLALDQFRRELMAQPVILWHASVGTR